MSNRQIKALNLEIRTPVRKVKNPTSTYSLNCNFEKTFKHEFHSEDKQMNTLVDLIINAAGNQDKLEEHLLELLSTRNKALIEIKENLHFIKNKNDDILKYITSITQNKNKKKQHATSLQKKILEKLDNKYQELETLMKYIKKIALA